MSDTSSDLLRSKIIFSFVAFALGMMVSALILQKNTSAPLPQTTPLMTYKGSDKGLEDLPLSVAMPYYELANETITKQRAMLEEAALQLFIAEQAKATQRTYEETQAVLFEKSAISDDEINRFYNEHKDEIKQPFFEIRDEITAYLTQQKRFEARNLIIKELTQKGDLAILLEKPVSPILQIDTQGYPSQGNTMAKVNIIEFADYQCPHCKHAADTLKRLLRDHGDKIRFTYMDLPINRSGISRTLAEGAQCALLQGKFWEYHDLAFEQQLTLSKSSPLDFAKQLQLDQTAFEQCLNAPETAAKVKASEKQAIELGARGTPAIYINGRKFSGQNLDSDLESEVTKLL